MSYAVSKYQPQRSKAGVAMSLLINGGAIAALILFPSVVILQDQAEPWTPEPPTTVPLDPPKPEPLPPVEEPIQQNTKSVVETPVTLVEVPTPNYASNDADTDLPVTIYDMPDIPTYDEPAAEFPVIVYQPKPVFVGPALNQRYASGFQPNYPPSLRRQEITGDVRVKVLVGTNGRVKQVQELGATHPDFFAATKKQALRNWRFIPATEDGRKVEAWFTISVKFEMEKN